MRRKQNKGFTLAELLIVVAIIGVLVAIGIPIYTSQLERACEAVDADNLRTAYSVLAAALISDTGKDLDRTHQGDIYYFYNGEKGEQGKYAHAYMVMKQREPNWQYVKIDKVFDDRLNAYYRNELDRAVMGYPSSMEIIIHNDGSLTFDSHDWRENPTHPR